MELNALLEAIDQAEERELNAVVLRVLARYAELFPDVETMFFSLPLNNPEEVHRIMDELNRYVTNRTA